MTYTFTNLLDLNISSVADLNCASAENILCLENKHLKREIGIALIVEPVSHSISVFTLFSINTQTLIGLILSECSERILAISRTYICFFEKPVHL